MNGNKFIKIIIFLLSSLITENSLATENITSLSNSAYTPHPSVKASFYSMDSELVHQGYSIQNTNNKLIIFHNNKVIPEASFGGPIGPNEAKKLYIYLKNTLRSANIYLNKELIEHTDKDGVAFIDIYKEVGKYVLELTTETDNIKVGYLFLLDRDIKLICGGERFNCEEGYY